MSTYSNNHSQLLALLRSLESAAARDANAALTQILAAFATLPSDLQETIQSLKKAGAWPDKPLEPNNPASPYYMVDPCAIEIENMPPAMLQAQLAEQSQLQPPPADQYGNAQVTLTLLLDGSRAN